MNSNKNILQPDKPLSVMLVGGFGHAVCVFNEWINAAPVQLTAAVQTLADESLDGFLSHPWSKQFRPVIYTDLNKALAAEKPDMVVVSTRPDHICAAVRAAVEAGVDVISEKPLALTDSDLKSLFNVVKQSGRRVMPMFSMRAMPAFRIAQEWVLAGKIGEPVLINARKSYKWGTRPAWFGDRGSYGGTWPWVGIHALDMSNFITGLSPVSVTAVHANRCHPDRPGCEDSCAGLFTLDNGGMLTASVDILRPGSAPTHGDDYCRIVGTQGIIEANASKGKVSLLQNGEAPVEQDCSIEEQAIYASFLRKSGDLSAGRNETSLAFMLTDAVLRAREAADTGESRLIDPKQWNLEN